MSVIIKNDFFNRDVLEVAPELIGKLLVREIDGKRIVLRISEVEVYKGEEDTACHSDFEDIEQYLDKEVIQYVMNNKLYC